MERVSPARAGEGLLAAPERSKLPQGVRLSGGGDGERSYQTLDLTVLFRFMISMVAPK
jgi:hypothetical protein